MICHLKHVSNKHTIQWNQTNGTNVTDQYCDDDNNNNVLLNVFNFLDIIGRYWE